MKKLSPFKLLLITPAIVLSSCGYGLKEVYSGIPYNSTNYFENYYNVWNKKINPFDEGNEFSLIKDEYLLSDDLMQEVVYQLYQKYLGDETFQFSRAYMKDECLQFMEIVYTK